MKDREQRRPLLKEDVDHLIRDETGRGLERNDTPRMSGSWFRACAEEGTRIDISRQSACLLGFLFEGLWELLDDLG